MNCTIVMGELYLKYFNKTVPKRGKRRDKANIGRKKSEQWLSLSEGWGLTGKEKEGIFRGARYILYLDLPDGSTWVVYIVKLHETVQLWFVYFYSV